MARQIRSGRQFTGLYHAREARGMSRTELVKLSGISKQQLSRLEGGQIRLRLDHLKPFAPHLGYTPEQILLWGRYPGTGELESSAAPRGHKGPKGSTGPALGQVREFDSRSGDGARRRAVRKDGRHADPVKPEGWVFPESFVRDELRTTSAQLLVIGADGDSMAPTIAAGDRVVVDTGHRTPTPDGLYAMRDALKGIVVKRLQLLRSARPPRVRIISDNPSHPAEEVPINDLEIVGKVVCCLKLF
jgi:transcriptional regulator with XRE-family HTH domain